MEKKLEPTSQEKGGMGCTNTLAYWYGEDEYEIYQESSINWYEGPWIWEEWINESLHGRSTEKRK
jgi:hypothetical protein